MSAPSPEGRDSRRKLWNKQKSEGLTEEEKHERALLRREYLDAVKANLESQLEHTYLQRPDGTRVPMKKRKD